MDAKLYDTPGGVVKLHSSLTVDQQSAIMKKYGTKVEDTDKQMEMSCDTIIAAFLEWNIGKDGALLPCTVETLKQFSMRDFFSMLQACTGRKLLDDEGNILSEKEIAKKGESA